MHMHTHKHVHTHAHAHAYAYAYMQSLLAGSRHPMHTGGECCTDGCLLESSMTPCSSNGGFCGKRTECVLDASYYSSKFGLSPCVPAAAATCHEHVVYDGVCQDLSLLESGGEQIGEAVPGPRLHSKTSALLPLSLFLYPSPFIPLPSPSLLCLDPLLTSIPSAP